MSRAVEKKLPPLNQRFVDAMERLGLSGYALSKALGTSEAVISHIRNGKNPPNILLVQELLNKYEELDPDWLLSGRGKMFRRPNAMGLADALPVSREGGISVQALDERLERMERLMQRSVEAQMERNVLVDEAVSDLEKQVGRLEKSVDTLKKDRRKSA
ncbi:MAG: helix-turn-helix transcriptional regulator [Flavobacteriales bacterium]|nr:helix-turn-helix transcriptional regulator [Flavobacteriales bacterium]